MVPETKNAQERFIQLMSEFDPAVPVLLKGHLLIEEALEGILIMHVFHSKHLNEARLSFHQKMCVVRSLGHRKAHFGEWELIQVINGLRNELAHQLEPELKEKKMARLREVYFREAAGMEGVSELRGLDDPDLISTACAHAIGFLSSMQADSKALRGFVHALDRVLNPDLAPFERTPRLFSRDKQAASVEVNGQAEDGAGVQSSKEFKTTQGE